MGEACLDCSTYARSAYSASAGGHCRFDTYNSPSREVPALGTGLVYTSLTETERLIV